MLACTEDETGELRQGRALQMRVLRVTLCGQEVTEAS